MMSKLIARVPLNSTSLGNVSINILKDLYEKNFDVAQIYLLKNEIGRDSNKVSGKIKTKSFESSCSFF